MAPTAPTQQRLGFPTQWGRFTITADAFDTRAFSLALTQADGETVELGKYRSINDALIAVSRQETGLECWDLLPPREVPYRVHDLICWEFDHFLEQKRPPC